jgi:GT2 family glycosyltransferase
VKNQTHEIDVVIPTLDRPEQLTATLEALTRQSLRNFGVIVVDDGSRSDIESMVPLTLRAALRIRFVRNEKSLGAGGARNRGVAESDAQYVVFIDDDCVAGRHLIRQHYEALSSTDAPTVSLGPIWSPPGRRLPVWQHWDAEHLEREYRRLACGQTTPGWEHLFTGNVALRRADFLAVGGFDQRLPRGEDTELGFRLAAYGCRFEFDSAASVWHDSQRSLQSWMKIAADAAMSDVDMHRRDPDGNRLAIVEKQLNSRHWATRLMRHAFGGPIAARCATFLAIALGLLLHAVRADRMALPAFSLVHDLTYWRSFQRALLHQPRPSSHVMEGAL